MGTINVFTEKFKNIIMAPLTTVQLETNDKDLKLDSSISSEWSPSNDKKSCSYCRVEFPDSKVQREHYKLDWHRYNLKQSLLIKPPISEDDFNIKIEKDDVSSISGSDSEKEDTLDTFANAQGIIFLKNDKGAVVSLYKSLVMNKKEIVTDEEIGNRLRNYCQNKWTILMIGGGHFAGAVFQDNEVIIHKTFHYYTVRAGQGGSQSSRDSKSSGTQPKSAGASLRRNNEQAFIQHVRTLLDSWKEHLEDSLVIYRASGGYNQSILFGGNNSILNKKDMRSIPFPTRRPTFKEVKRVHQLLTTVSVYDSVDKAVKSFAKEVSPERESKRNKIRSSCINRAKSRENVERPLPTEHLSSESEIEDDTKELLSTADLEISFDDLKEFDDSLTAEQRKKTKKKKSRKSKNKKLKELEECRKKNLIELICNGDLEQLQHIYEEQLKLMAEERNIEEFINQIVDNESNTLLHIAAQKEQKDIMDFLLKHNANPCLKNKEQLTAYTCTQSKEIREFLRQFARENPEKHNYNKAQIPINALTNEEVAEKRKAMRKVKREKEKEKKKENEIKRKEDEEKKRFLTLSDREKRALAAERRIISQSGKVTKRCFLCGSDIAGKVPFEYMQNLFCTIDCLKAHRMQNPLVLS
ncbi:ankyrin repeat and zinc finger domain-containing protein 1-like [Diorhabda carinulata]|uniref:ankyrin repeat and zinc finger domain-containing protein 1-like n=1 Tax=Diorhabda carinulata TaxID=1163345 RepID=UPI0025A14241|nr:ankyrin repeat and zinc finger domain-containing protein 1-like [Diorhabda carinulata]XP_057657992.1 ankyrin repeat and zinc finger domain-containing protein 1-like [Diorhabda carinulata]